MKQKAVNLAFATPILTYEIPEKEFLNQQLLEEISAIRTSSDGVKISNQHGWHSETDLFRRPEQGIKELCTNIVKAINLTTHQVAPKFKIADHKIKLQGWININQKGAYNTPHDHPGYNWSGCYYVNQPSVDEGRSGMIEFLDPRTSPRNMSVLKAASFAPKFQIRPKARTLIVFPSYLVHWVYPNELDEERVSIAFNGRYTKKKDKAKG